MLAIWSLMHGTAVLIIRGGFDGSLKTQAIHACLDTAENIIQCAKRKDGMVHSGPNWPANLILGEGEHSRIGNGGNDSKQKSRTAKRRR
jgi:hypothetical protein